jgi:hypothetical protein
MPSGSLASRRFLKYNSLQTMIWNAGTAGWARCAAAERSLVIDP